MNLMGITQSSHPLELFLVCLRKCLLPILELAFYIFCIIAIQILMYIIYGELLPFAVFTCWDILVYIYNATF